MTRQEYDEQHHMTRHDAEAFDALLDQFKDQINWAIRKLILKFGRWLDSGGDGYQDLYWKAAEFMWGYASRAYVAIQQASAA